MKEATHTLTKSDLLQQARKNWAVAQSLLYTTPKLENIMIADSNISSQIGAYGCLAALKAIDAYVVSRGITSLPENLNEYRLVVDAMSCAHQIYPRLNIAIQNLQVFAYQMGASDFELLQSGLKRVKEIIDIIEKVRD